jgi:hypothetical protein
MPIIDPIVQNALTNARLCLTQLRGADNIPAVAVRAIDNLIEVCERQQEQIEDIPRQIAAAAKAIAKAAESRRETARILDSMGHGL